MSELSELTGIYLYGSLRGSLPPEWGRLLYLTEIDLENNQLRGSLPPEWALLPRLNNIWLNDNRLSGAIPSAFGPWYVAASARRASHAFPNDVAYVILSGNSFTGCLPTGFDPSLRGNDFSSLNLPAC